MAVKTSLLAGLALPILAMAAPTPTPQDSQISEIVGGEDAEIGEFPSLVAVVYEDGKWCGGSLLNADTVVTAAHCTEYEASSYSIRAGTNVRLPVQSSMGAKYWCTETDGYADLGLGRHCVRCCYHHQPPRIRCWHH